MKISHELERSGPPLVLAIGFFDGMHLGHQEIARRTLALRKPGWRAGVLTFANHPATHLRPGSEPPLICTLAERVDLFARYGYDECFLIPFDERIARIEAPDFARIVLIERMGVRGVVVGNTFAFGHRRLGDAAMLRAWLEEAGVAFDAVEQLADGIERISSTRIRLAIAAGECAEADRLLGHPFEIRGRVELGFGRGHDLEFPTANIAVPDKLLPADGVYAANARYDGRDYAALVSIGTNPTFDGTSRTVEAWLRDFHETIYGKELTVRDLRFLRSQRKFASPEQLLAQMQADRSAVAYPAFG
jgi:riboflavin kinase/FMN adenylyltransferase